MSSKPVAVMFEPFKLLQANLAPLTLDLASDEPAKLDLANELLVNMASDKSLSSRFASSNKAFGA